VKSKELWLIRKGAKTKHLAKCEVAQTTNAIEFRYVWETIAVTCGRSFGDVNGGSRVS
jgi:hypothetical protein